MSQILKNASRLCLLVALAAALPATGARSQCAIRFDRELDPFPMIDGLGPVPNAFYGGWQDVRPQLVDIDQDGDLDLFVLEEEGQLRFLRNVGGPAAPQWVQETDDYAGVHEFYFARFVDLDADGDHELLVEAPPFPLVVGENVINRIGAYVYTDVGTPGSPDYRNLSTHPEGYFTDELGDPIAFEQTTPDFVDLDADGDQDLLMGRSSGDVILYRNVGTPQSAVFRLESESYRGLRIIAGACSPSRAEASSGAHGFMLFSFADVNADSRPDLFVGDSFVSNSYYLQNIGTGISPDFVCQTENYFPGPGGGQGFFGIRLLSTFGDLDGDGDVDALFGSGEANSLGLHFYRNQGTPNFPLHRQESPDWIPELDLGNEGAPAFVDLDRDGDQDLFFGNPTRQALSRWDNVGDAMNPTLAVIQPAWTTVANAEWLAPEFADLDADGDLDLFLGGSLGEIRWYRNDGDGPEPTDFVEMTSDAQFGPGKIFSQIADSQSVPRFLDGDGDGDLDLVVGHVETQDPRTGLLYFRNDGTPQQHDFVFATGDFSGLGTFGRGPAPAFADLDGDGDLDGIVGQLDGTFSLLRNVGSPSAPAFVREQDGFGGFDVGARAVPVFVDADADGDADLVVGESGGGLNFYRNITTLTTPPSPFALVSPAPDAGIDGRRDAVFSWDPSFTDGGSGPEASYELRLTADRLAPPTEWVVRPVTGLQETVRLYLTPLRFATDFWWTVAATDGCTSAPQLEWRPALHLTPDLIHGEQPPKDPEAPVPGTGPQSLAFELTNAFPSPSADGTTLEFRSPREARVRVTVHDASGRTVATVADRVFGSGAHSVRWDGRNDAGAQTGPGIYVVRLEQDGRVLSRRVARVR